MFTPITLNTWPRREIFYFFSQMAPTGYSLTVSLDVTELYHTVKNAGFKFFPAYLWLVTKNLNEQVEFKCAVQDGQLGYFDVLTPLYATIHPDDHTLSLMWTEYCDAFPQFHERYVENQTRFADIMAFWHSRRPRRLMPIRCPVCRGWNLNTLPSTVMRTSRTIFRASRQERFRCGRADEACRCR